MGMLATFAVETALLNSFAWIMGALVAALVLGPIFRRKGASFGLRWLAYAGVASLAGLWSFLGFDAGSNPAVATIAAAWIAMFLAAGAFVAVAMAISMRVHKR